MLFFWLHPKKILAARVNNRRGVVMGPDRKSEKCGPIWKVMAGSKVAEPPDFFSKEAGLQCSLVGRTALHGCTLRDMSGVLLSRAMSVDVVSWKFPWGKWRRALTSIIWIPRSWPPPPHASTIACLTDAMDDPLSRRLLGFPEAQGPLRTLEVYYFGGNIRVTYHQVNRE